MVRLEKDEHIIIEVRKHWFFLLTEICLAVIFALLPIFSMPILEGLGLEINLPAISLVFFFYLLWLLFLWVFVFIFWTNFYLDVWIITNQKIFSIEQHRLFTREVAVLHYEKIQDITYEVHGLIYAILNLGDVHVQTAGTERNFTIRGIKDPSYIQKKLNEVLLKKNISKEVSKDSLEN
jgi:uncharacterized membrane protein YdbT with pleckstrin-like domain